MKSHHQRRQNSERGRGVASLRIVNPTSSAPMEVLDARGRTISSSGSGSYVPWLFQDENGDYDPMRANVAAMGGVVVVSAVVVALIARAWKSEPAPVDIGLKIASNCSSYEVTNQTLMEKNIVAEVKRQAARGSVDPFDVAASYVRRASSTCSVYPSPPRSGVEVDVFSFVFGLVIDAMAKQNLLTDISKATFEAMLGTWNLQVSSSSQGQDSYGDSGDSIPDVVGDVSEPQGLSALPISPMGGIDWRRSSSWPVGGNEPVDIQWMNNLWDYRNVYIAIYKNGAPFPGYTRVSQNGDIAINSANVYLGGNLAKAIRVIPKVKGDFRIIIRSYTGNGTWSNKIYTFVAYKNPGT